MLKKTIIILLLFLATALDQGGAMANNQQTALPRAPNNSAIATLQAGIIDQPFTFAFLGDSRNSPTFTKMVQQLNRDKDLGFVIIGGDVVDMPDAEAFNTFLQQKNAIKPPTLMLAGNHDVDKNDSSMYRRIFGPLYYSFTVANAKFIILDDSNKTDLGENQLAWLEKQLQQSATNRYRFVFMHVPLWDPQVAVGKTGHSLKNTEADQNLIAMLAKYKVDLIFASHIHAFYRTSRHGLQMIISGGAGANLDGNDPNHAFYHYTKVTVAKTGIKAVAIQP